MRTLQDAGGEFGTYAYLSYCLENGIPLPVDLLAHLAARGWVIQDQGEIKPAEVAAINEIVEEEQLDLLDGADRDYLGYIFEDAERPCDTE